MHDIEVVTKGQATNKDSDMWMWLIGLHHFQ